MIPKVVHYCWFGGNQLPDDAKKCIESWRKFFPEYEIKEWNERNFDVNCCDYVKEAYAAQKWAFVSDYARFWILYHEGGLYFDTDVELLKPIDSLLEYKAFIALEVGSPTPYGRLILANSGSGIGAEPHSETVRKMMRVYESIPMITETGRIDHTTCSERATHVLKKLGFDGKNRFQTVADFTQNISLRSIMPPKSSEQQIIHSEYIHTTGAGSIPHCSKESKTAFSVQKPACLSCA